MRYFILIFCTVLLISACENDLEEVNKFVNKDDVSIEIAKDVERGTPLQWDLIE